MATDPFARWVDARLNTFAHHLGCHIADRLLEVSGLGNISDQFGSFLLGLNGTLTKALDDALDETDEPPGY